MESRPDEAKQGRATSRRRWAIRLALAILMLVAAWWIAHRGPRIPALLAGAIPDDCSQVVLVLSPEAASVQAQVWLLERGSWGWRVVQGPWTATLGHRGLAWGTGLHTTSAPEGFPLKREGDLCSPAGVFRIPFAFGLAPAGEASWLRLPYTPLTGDIVGVDDPGSSHYNQVVDRTTVEVDWNDDQPMRRRGAIYEWGAFIGQNPDCVPGAGSVILFHRWSAPGQPTAGCTGLSAGNLRTMLEWLDASRHPVLVQGLESW